MTKFLSAFRSSVMTYITISIASIIAVGLFTIFISFWITELTDKDAQAINVSGSMRMQTYHIALALEQGNISQAKTLINKLDATWNDALFTVQHQSDKPLELDEDFRQAFEHWNNTLLPLLNWATQDAATPHIPIQLVDKQVAMTDQLVQSFQKYAEQKIRNLRAFQLFAFFITIGVGSIVFYVTKNRIEKPLTLLTETATNIGKGRFGEQVDVKGEDELAQLAAVINNMSRSIASMYNKMDEEVKRRTEQLSQRNITLNFLFKIVRAMLDSSGHNLDFEALIRELNSLLGEDISLELCLFTSQGVAPYLHVTNVLSDDPSCDESACDRCQGDAPFCPSKSEATRCLDYKFPIVRDASNYGVITARSGSINQLPEWQENLLLSVADHFSMAMSLTREKEQEHRITMLNERTVIARELHDSLAQSLSYLQIQATRLQKSQDKQRFDLQPAIIDELREGLSSAYRQLRELLTTFRLKIDAEGLYSAIDNTVEQLSERSNLKIQAHYNIADIPLTPSEEIHLLQIIREALQNAVSHSKGSRVDIYLNHLPDKHIELIVEDDGIGIADSPEKLNHYGLAIMSERSKHLNGVLTVEPREQGGTRVTAHFVPHYVQNCA